MRTPTLLLVALSLPALTAGASLPACSKPSEPTEAPKPAEPHATAAMPAQGTDTHTAPPAHATSNKPSPADGADSAGKTAGGLRFDAPKPFVSRQPKSSMRAAEFGIEGDPQSELAVFYFGPDQGGSVEANMERWIGQFTAPDGSKTEGKRGERSVHDISIATVEATGSYGGGMAPPGAPPPATIDDAMLLGAIAKGPQGSVFFKLVGPRASVDGARNAFDQLLESVSKAQ